MILIIIILLLLVAILFKDFIKKHFTILTLQTIILNIVSYIFLDISNIINAGYVGMAFFIVVMFSTSFNKKSALYKSTLYLRKEYSIFGFIFITSHCLLYLFSKYQMWEWNGIVAFILMIPISIISFSKIKKKLSRRSWDMLQLFSYIIYLLIFIHVIVIGQSSHVVMYLVITFCYVVLKIKNGNFNKLKKYRLTPLIISLSLIVTFANISYTYFMSNEVVVTNSVVEVDNTIVSEEIDIEEVVETESFIYNDGTYYVEKSAYKNHTLKANITIISDEVTEIEIIDCGCSEASRGIDYEASVEEVIQTIVSLQTDNVDSVSGATISTQALIDAVSEVYEIAKIT